MTKVLETGFGPGDAALGKSCSACFQLVDDYHESGCPEARMQEAAKRRPANFDELSAEERWAIDKELGCLDWNGF